MSTKTVYLVKSQEALPSEATMGAHPREHKLSEQELNQDTTTDTDIDVQRLEQMLFTWFAIPRNMDQHDAPLLLSLKKQESPSGATLSSYH
jgi:hypothetical protein